MEKCHQPLYCVLIFLFNPPNGQIPSARTHGLLCDKFFGDNDMNRYISSFINVNQTQVSDFIITRSCYIVRY